MAMAAALRRQGKRLAPLISSSPINNNILLRSSFISPALLGDATSVEVNKNVVITVSSDKGNYTSMCTAGYNPSVRNHYLQPTFQQHLFTKLCKGAMFEKHNFLSTSSNNSTEDGSEQEETISVTFVDKDGEEKPIKVPIGMSMLEAAHENDIELEGACEGSLACSTCHVIIMDLEYYNKLEDPTDEENDMLDLAFGLSETSRLGCQVIAKPELDGIRLAIPAATRNFAVDGYVPKPH